jgi:phosphoribosylformylglycinamidine synthase
MRSIIGDFEADGARFAIAATRWNDAIVDGLADMCAELAVPVVGGNVSLYNDSPSGPIPPTPTLAMAGTKAGYDAPTAELTGEGELLVVGGTEDYALGGSELLTEVGGTDRFPALPEDANPLVDAIADVANQETTRSTHDVSHGGLAATLAEMIGEAGAEVTLDAADTERAAERLFSEAVGRVVVETTDPEAVYRRFDGVAPVERLGVATDTGRLELAVGGVSLTYTSDEIAALRDVIASELA